jgi:type IV pilus assembly protein PilF
MAYFREKVGDYPEADRLYKQAIKLSLNNKGAVYNNYGAYLCRQAQYEAADEAFQKALQDKDYARTAEVYENAGLCALKASNIHLVQKAQTYLRQAIQHDPTREQARQALTVLQQQSNTGNVS